MDAEEPKETQQQEVRTEEERIDYEKFSKVNLQTATVIEAERVPNSDKLLRMQIDLGREKRQLVAGIAESYSPEEMVGKQIIVVANLQPRKIRGVESDGMLLAVQGQDGRIVLLSPETKAENGLRVQ